MTIQEQRTELENSGWFVGNRDRSQGGDAEGIFMVSRADVCLVGDDLSELVVEAWIRYGD